MYVCVCACDPGQGTSQEKEGKQTTSPMTTQAVQPQATPNLVTTPPSEKTASNPSSSNLSQQHSRTKPANTDEGEESQDTYDEDLEGVLHSSPNVDMKSAIIGARKSLARKLAWASAEMDKTTSIEYCTQLATFIQSTSAAILRLKDL